MKKKISAIGLIPTKTGLLLALSFIMVLQMLDGFGKCSQRFYYTRSSDSYTTQTDIGNNDTIYLSFGDTIHVTFQWYCIICGDMLWFENGNIIGTNVYSMYITSAGFYEFRTCIVYYMSSAQTQYYKSFTVMPSVTGINDINTANQLYPFSNLSSNVNVNNLRYTLINCLGQIIDEGKTNGEAILRRKNISSSLKPGIYFVMYYDGETNERVLIDKVLVTDNQ